MVSLSARYDDGERDDVWRELRVLGPRVRESEYLDDASAVARTMALRARHNVEVLVERLGEAGFDPQNNDGEGRSRPMHVPPGPGAPALASWLSSTYGPIPLTIDAWIREVGDVWLVGRHPAWPGSDQADPLFVEFEYSLYDEDPRDYYLGEHDAWLACRDAELDEPFRLDFAPDRLHKGNVSGGPPYGVVVPGPSVDGTIRLEEGAVSTFVPYLNEAFVAGGFPYLRVPAPTGLRESLASDMLPAAVGPAVSGAPRRRAAPSGRGPAG